MSSPELFTSSPIDFWTGFDSLVGEVTSPSEIALFFLMSLTWSVKLSSLGALASFWFKMFVPMLPLNMFRK